MYSTLHVYRGRKEGRAVKFTFRSTRYVREGTDVLISGIVYLHTLPVTVFVGVSPSVSRFTGCDRARASRPWLDIPTLQGRALPSVVLCFWTTLPRPSQVRRRDCGKNHASSGTSTAQPLEPRRYFCPLDTSVRYHVEDGAWRVPLCGGLTSCSV